MSYRLFAMDTYFAQSLGVYGFETRCEIVKELGYDATYLSLFGGPADWECVPKLGGVSAKYGLDVAGVYITLDITAADNDPVVRLVRELEGCRQIELSVRAIDGSFAASDPAGDDAACRWLEELLTIAEHRGITIALYPHISFWLERMEDAERLCRRIDHPNLRMVFPSFHWFAIDGTRLPDRLSSARPFLTSANLCGSRRTDKNEGGRPATIETLEEGTLDNFAILSLLSRIGYDGMIGFQGFSIGGDVYTNLKRSILAFRDMEHRLERHPNWAPWPSG